MGQRPFIQNSTLKENITFGLDYDDFKYRETIEQCALVPDLQVNDVK
jgi:ABC-type transport system involved in cytochrome bd biosynthesis fused ATPase/permease subunit